MPPEHRPSIVGAGQHRQRLEDPHEAIAPIDMMEAALRKAAEDAGAPGILSDVDAILVPQGIWKYGDPGRILGERIGASHPKTALGAVSGHMVQCLVDWAFEEIAAGRQDVVAIVGGESENSKRRIAKSDVPLHWDEQTEGEPDLRIGSNEITLSQHEIDAGVFKPTMSFAMCDTAWRYERGESPAQHRVRISELSSRLSAVAAKNPYAWVDRHVPANEIREESPENRMVSYPYTKLMTANIAVDQSAALIVCSESAARKHGIAEAKKVYLQVATEMNHVVHLTARNKLYHHPGLELAGRRALEILEIGADRIEHVDLYSCFPFAVQAGAAALGLDEERPLTVTGGLTFFGGPFANYVLHAKAQMVELLRASPGAIGMVGSVGGTFAKFSFGAYSTDPGSHGEALIEDVSQEVATLPLRPVWEGDANDFAGAVEIESYVVDVMPAGPVHASFSTLDEVGRRIWARSSDSDLMQALLNDEDVCGRSARVEGGMISLN